MLDIGTVLKLLRDNVERTGLPVPASREDLTGWSRGLDLPSTGETLLYTGALYQLLPRIDALARQLESLEKGRAGRALFRAAGRFGRLAGLAGLVLRPRRGDVEYAERVLRSIVGLLRSAGVNISYDPGLDGYSGVLLYDLGLDSDFRRHAERVARALQERGPELVVTVDPHTTHVLREVYPRFFPWFQVRVRSYLEILAEHADEVPWLEGSAGQVTVHDPCFYARHLNIYREPRLLLERAGYRVVNPRRWGRLTYCCGGPLESVSPGLSRRIAERRVGELRETGARVAVVMCPICLANLRRVGGIGVEDISVVLAGRVRGLAV